ncbi:hypothetical protein Hanom_Chr01g00004131 [Helianthus anomalus]
MVLLRFFCCVSSLRAFGSSSTSMTLLNGSMFRSPLISPKSILMLLFLFLI